MSSNDVERAEGDPIYFRYRLQFDDGREHVFTVELDYDTLDIIQEWPESPPQWCRLTFHQCPNCPLSPDQHPFCPVAVQMRELIGFLLNLISYEHVRVTVETVERTYSADSTLQRVAGSLMGIYMTTSGCPILNKMRPMVETHLPFSNWQETVYRVMSMYLMAQYFLKKNGREPSWDIQGIVSYYDQVQAVNNAFADRLRAIPRHEGDASLNAITLLASNASMASMTLQDNDLAHWERIFMDHWGGPGTAPPK